MAKGAKTCPKCKAVVGCRTHQCVCGYTFQSAINPVENNTDHERMCYPLRGNTISTPAGKCPVPYQGDLQSWIISLQGHIDAKEGNQYAPRALRYFLRGMVSPEEYAVLAPQIVSEQLAA